MFRRMHAMRPACSICLSVLLSVALLSVAAVAGDNIWTGNGPYGGDIRALAIDPSSPQTVYAGTESGGVFKSANGGNSWTAVNSGLPTDTVYEVYDLAIDPKSPQTVYAGTQHGGVFKSTNGGTSWTTFNSGLTFPDVTDLAIDPSSPQTLYAGTDGGGVFAMRLSGAGAQPPPALDFKQTAFLKGHTDVVRSVAFSPDGKTLASGSTDYTVGLWSSTPVATPPGAAAGLASDFDGNGSVDFDDFFAFAAAFGKKQGEAGFDARFDLSKNGEVDFDDFFTFAGEFGKTTKSGKRAASRPGVNDRASLSVGTVTSEDGLTARVGASNVAQIRGYSMGVNYDPSVLTFVKAERATDALMSRGGSTPLFLTREVEPGQVVIADAIASGGTASGDGSLANLIFRRIGPKASASVNVDLAQTFDGTGGVNVLAAAAKELPSAYALSQNYPNPFNPATQIAYQLPQAGEVSLAIYNLLGQQVRTLAQGRQEAGYYRATWDGRDAYGRPVSSGIYFYRLTSGGFAETRKMMLLK